MDVLLTDIDTLDMTNAEQVSSLPLQFRPDVVINTAAYTQVDKAEEAVNATALIYSQKSVIK
ncbi:sugar nucleotide-binding protein [Moritella sp. 36]|uniref:sugar nucleotide-binding protein n=1 Tax=Moritella sp. 36 TaxID=2746233 RepID=UPI0021053561|nr:sugar nucleotide-binding protein [Moritella sp. 36]